MKHRARRVPPPDHGRLDEIRYYPVEQVRWDMGFNSRTVPFHAVRVEPSMSDDRRYGPL